MPLIHELVYESMNLATWQCQFGQISQIFYLRVPIHLPRGSAKDPQQVAWNSTRSLKFPRPINLAFCCNFPGLKISIFGCFDLHLSPRPCTVPVFRSFGRCICSNNWPMIPCFSLTSILRLKLEVWFRWCSFSNGWFSGSICFLCFFFGGGGRGRGQRLVFPAGLSQHTN